MQKWINWEVKNLLDKWFLSNGEEEKNDVGTLRQSCMKSKSTKLITKKNGHPPQVG